MADSALAGKGVSAPVSPADGSQAAIAKHTKKNAGAKNSFLRFIVHLPTVSRTYTIHPLLAGQQAWPVPLFTDPTTEPLPMYLNENADEDDWN